MLQWTRGQPLGHVPYEVTLVGADGARYRGVVDITPSKIKSTHSGYEALKNLELERVEHEVPSDRESVTNFAAQQPMASKTSPLQAFWNHKS